jgi:hypothetical protein
MKLEPWQEAVLMLLGFALLQAILVYGCVGPF